MIVGEYENLSSYDDILDEDLDDYFDKEFDELSNDDYDEFLKKFRRKIGKVAFFPQRMAYKGIKKATRRRPSRRARRYQRKHRKSQKRVNKYSTKYNKLSSKWRTTTSKTSKYQPGRKYTPTRRYIPTPTKKVPTLGAAPVDLRKSFVKTNTTTSSKKSSGNIPAFFQPIVKKKPTTTKTNLTGGSQISGAANPMNVDQKKALDMVINSNPKVKKIIDAVGGISGVRESTTKIKNYLQKSSNTEGASDYAFSVGDKDKDGVGKKIFGLPASVVYLAGGFVILVVGFTVIKIMKVKKPVEAK